MRPASLNLLSSFRFLRNPLRAAPILHAKKGRFVRLSPALGGMILVFEPEDVAAILGQPDTFEHLDQKTIPVRLPPGSATFRLTSGLLAFQNGEKHRSLRRELTSAFDMKHLQNYFSLSRESVRAFIEGMDNQGGPQDLNRICHQLAMNTALLTLFGLRMDSETSKLSDSFKAWMEAGFSPWTILFPFDLPGFSYRRLLRAGEVLEHRLHRILIQGPQSSDPLVKMVFGESWKQGELPPELVSRASGYMQASYETTSNTLIWTLVLLNLFPEAARSAIAEIDQVVGNGEIEYRHLMAMPYLRAVVTESIRLLPPLSLFPRSVSRSVSIGGLDLSPGDRVAYGPILTHRLPHVFTRPFAFDPGRFQKGARMDGFLGFGGGPRRCPGEQFGLNEVMLILATWLRRRFPRIEEGTVINARGMVVLAPLGAIPFRNQDRRDWKPSRASLKGTAVWGIEPPET